MTDHTRFPADVLAAATAVEDEILASDLHDLDTQEVIAKAILAERERCAVIAESYSGMAHTAFDLKSKSFPTKSPVQDFIAKQIRGEA